MSERSTEHRAPGNKARSQGPEPPSIQESQDRLMSRRNARGGAYCVKSIKQHRKIRMDMYSVCWIIWESLETSANRHGDWREQNKSDRGRGAIQRRRVELPGDDGSLAELREERAAREEHRVEGGCFRGGGA